MSIMRSRPVRWVLRAIGGCLVLLLVAAGGLLAINFHDEALLPAAAAIIEGKTVVPVAPEQNLFFTFIGLSSTEGDEPNAEGRRIFALYQQALGRLAADPSQRLNPDRSDFYALAKVREFHYSPELIQLCNQNPQVGAFHCIADAASRRPLWEKILADNRGRLDRFRQVSGEPQYLNVLTPVLVAPTIRYFALTTAKRLQVTSWALQLDSGGQDQVIGALAADLGFWRAFVALRNPPLIEKSIAASQVRADLYFMSELLRIRQLTPGQYDALGASLHPSTVAERSVAGALDAELRWSAAILLRQSSENGPRYWFCSAFSAEHRFLNALSCAGFLRNATINRMYRNYHELAQLSEQSCEHFDSGYAMAREHLRRSPTDYLYNPTGTWEVSPGSASLDDYSAKFCNLEGMQRIVALQLAIRRNNLADAQIPAFLERAGADYADPFTGKPMQWDAQDRSLAFRTRPLQEGQLVRWPI